MAPRRAGEDARPWLPRAWESGAATWLRTDRLSSIKRYAVELIPALVRLAPGEIVLFTHSDVPPALAALDVERHVTQILGRLPLDQAWLPWAATRAHVDLLHTLASPTPVLWRGASAMTIHDATPWLHPDAMDTGTRWYMKPLYPQALSRRRHLHGLGGGARGPRSAGAPRGTRSPW